MAEKTLDYLVRLLLKEKGRLRKINKKDSKALDSLKRF